MSENSITHRLERGVLELRLDRVDKKNALTQAMYAELAEQLIQARANPEVRAIALLGQPECFSAGNDLTDFSSRQVNSHSGPIPQFMYALASCPKPVLAGPSGLAIGIGVTLLLHCDLVYCGDQTRLQMPFTRLGLCPEFASSYLIPRIAGMARAAEALLLGEAFTAQDALAMGLVTRLVPNSEVESHVIEKAHTLAAMAPSAIRATKQLLRRWPQDQTLAAIQTELDIFVPMLSSAEATEAFDAFAQKRKPDFSRFS